MRILIHEWVTGGGLAGTPLPPSWAAEGRAMRRAIARDFGALSGVDVVATVDARFADEVASHSSVVVGPGEEEATLKRLTAESDYTLLIAPETGGVLESRARLVGDAGGRLLGSEPSAVALTGDKQRLAEHLSGRGLRTVETRRFVVAKGLPDGVSFPAVVKPIDGAGGLQTYLVEGPEDLPRSDGLPTEMVIQPYCRGTPLSASFLVGPRGRVRLLGVGRQRVTVIKHTFRYEGGRLPAPGHFSPAEAIRAVRSVPGLSGFVGVDFIGDPETGSTTVIEINPRPTTSYVGLARLLPSGTLARAWLDLFDPDAIERNDDPPGMIDPTTRPGVDFFADGTVRDWREGDDDDRG